MTQVGFIRHGITDWNVQRRAQGQTDIPLNDTGRGQAYALANRLKSEEWDIIYSSDLSRAKETADIIANALGLTVFTDQRLREMYCGELEGTSIEDRIANWGKDWDSLSLGVEADESIAERGISFASYLTEKYPGMRVLVVSHGALLGRTLKQLIPHVDTEVHLNNTSITKLTLVSGKWDCGLYNCAMHLT